MVQNGSLVEEKETCVQTDVQKCKKTLKDKRLIVRISSSISVLFRNEVPLFLNITKIPSYILHADRGLLIFSLTAHLRTLSNSDMPSRKYITRGGNEGGRVGGEGGSEYFPSIFKILEELQP